ncbi:MAG: DUF72 domain-containing protein [Actinomycetota bacterium]
MSPVPNCSPKRVNFNSTKELAKWAPKIEKLASDAKETHVLMNNCHADYAQRNAKELAELLREK